jgi:indole-3-glycerol phosphate synthase
LLPHSGKACPAAFGDRSAYPPMEVGSHEKSILGRIVEMRRESIAHRKRVLPEVALKIAVEKKAPAARDFAGAISRGRLNVIAELKKASPSRGVMREEYAPAALAASVAAGGAAAISVLTEEDFFHGSLADLKEVRGVVEIPVLRKDFIIDPWQVWEARAAGADSFLLIAAILGDAALKELTELGRSLKMEPLVEVHSREELERVVAAGARVVGVNNRDLHTFQVRLETSLALVESIPEECIAVSESGIHGHGDIERLHRAGFDAFLIGEQLMKGEDPGKELRALLEGPGAAGQPA